MRFMHIADLHIGKILNETDLSEDIKYVLFNEILGRIYSEVNAEKPVDALVIAGDVYDRSLPSADSEAVFGQFLSKAVKLGLKVFCTSGNHDSAIRMAANEQLFSNLNIYIPNGFSDETPVRVEQFGDFDIAMLPFISLIDVRSAYPDEDIPDTTAAVKTVLEKAGLPGTRPCILIAHQAVTKDGEDFIGNQQSVESSVFDGFTYTALGHIHTPQSFGERVRYCGSPLCFSSTEAKHIQKGQSFAKKYVDIVDVETNGNISVQHIEIRPLRNVLLIEDTFANLMSDKYNEETDYCYITVSEFEEVFNVIGQIRSKFPNMLTLKYRNSIGDNTENKNDEYLESESFSDSLKRFLTEAFGDEPDDELMQTAEYIFELTEKAHSENKISELKAQEPELNRSEKENCKNAD